MYNCNCKNIYYILEPVGTCGGEVIDLGFSATQEGVYKLKLSFLNSEISISKSFDLGEPLAFPTAGLNESQEWVGNVINPAGEIEKPIGEGGIIYDCFSFKTTIKISL